ncbi:iron complex outermembrane receptor protein [Sphingomonas vulcanisoli]|uniref:Iron complex outermembrane receptor protein n=1 Tax=Sphingomonas vulcanisoli TaxID=1658060 RepID=A0ABX0TT34_9SPHN|nr:TonB-dependent receptor [Sphingomonas vulcanisoli]NIJ08238.1 iron complex outermembrane receptor protein [Sphingomonas vulcanisoli]
MTTALALPGLPLRAQAVNYAALQDTFGEPVTTSVNGKPQRVSDAAASITIITRDQIQLSPARSVPDLLAAYAGVQVTHWTAGQSDVAVRGGVQTYNARLLVLVNGRQVYLDHYGMTDWNLLGIQIDEIQQIELVRGPASALFGFNAAAGVVNIITVDPLTAHQATVSAEGGTHGYSKIGGSFALPLRPNLGLSLSAGHQRENERAIPSSFYQPASIGDTIADQAAATLTATLDPATRIALNGGWSYNQQLEFLPSQIITEQRFHSATAGLQADHDTGWGSITAHAYSNLLDAHYGVTTSATDPIGQSATINVRNRIVVATSAMLIRLSEANTLRLGGEYRNNQLFSDRLFSHRIGYQVAAVDGMIDLHPTDRIAVTLAARLDHLWLGQGGAPQLPQIDPIAAYRRAFNAVSFNAALLARVGENGQLRVNGGRGIQSPSLVNFGSRVLIAVAGVPLPIYLSGDPNIRPATIWSGEIGYTHNFASGLRLEAGAFFTRTDNAISSPGNPIDIALVFTPAPVAVTRFANIGWFESRGVEISADGKLLPRLNWHANYTWTHVTEDLPADRIPYIYPLLPRLTTPEHVANLGADYSAGRWSASAVAHYTSATSQFAFRAPGTLLMVAVPQAVAIDAKLGYRFTHQLTGYVAGDNLTDASGADGSPIAADRRLRIGVRLVL